MREPNGMSKLELVKAVDLPLQRLEYHLKLLQAGGLAARVDDRRKPGKAGNLYAVAGTRPRPGRLGRRRV